MDSNELVKLDSYLNEDYNVSSEEERNYLPYLS